MVKYDNNVIYKKGKSFLYIYVFCKKRNYVLDY